MSAKKKNRATEKTKQHEMLERFLQSLVDLYNEQERQQEHYKRWWREIHQEYRELHPEKSLKKIF